MGVHRSKDEVVTQIMGLARALRVDRPSVFFFKRPGGSFAKCAWRGVADEVVREAYECLRLGASPERLHRWNEDIAGPKADLSDVPPPFCVGSVPGEPGWCLILHPQWSDYFGLGEDGAPRRYRLEHGSRDGRRKAAKERF